MLAVIASFLGESALSCYVMNTYTAKCFYCGRDLIYYKKRSSPLPADALTTDHTVPRAKGGTSEFGLLVPACQKCNGDKACLTLEEYRAVISQRNGLLENVILAHFPGEHSEWEGWNMKYWREMRVQSSDVGGNVRGCRRSIGDFTDDGAHQHSSQVTGQPHRQCRHYGFTTGG